MNFERFEKPKVIIQAGHTPLQAVGAGDMKEKLRRCVVALCCICCLVTSNANVLP
jgi:hypothetical protein